MLRTRGVDHLVLCVRDLEAARDAYRRLGFTLTPRAVHPFGTGNSLVQLRGSYLELLTVVDATKIVPPRPGEFSFAAFNQAFLDRHEGLSMLALESDDARRDRDEFAAAGLVTYPPLDFSRKAVLPDGQEVTLSFSLAFLGEARMAEAGFFVCQHRAAHLFWDPDYQTHANGAVSVTEVVMTAADPRAFVGFFARLQGRDAVSMQDGQLVVTTTRGKIVVLDPAQAARRFPGFDPRQAETPRFIGCRLAVSDLDVARRCVEASGLRHQTLPGMVQIAPGEAFGIVLEFIASGPV